MPDSQNDTTHWSDATNPLKDKKNLEHKFYQEGHTQQHEDLSDIQRDADDDWYDEAPESQ